MTYSFCNSQILNIQQSSCLQVPTGLLKVPDLTKIYSPKTYSQGGGEEATGLIHELRFSLIIPTFNEQENIHRLVQRLTQILDAALPNRYELILVDDDSADRTWEHAQALTSQYDSLRVMHRQRERGLSTAVIRGWQAARGEILGVIDADLQHPPSVLLQLLGEIDCGSDLVVASRHVEGGGGSHWSLTRRFLSRGAQLLGLIVLPKVLSSVSDPMSGHFLVRRRAIADISLDPVGCKILLEVLGRGRIEHIAEVGYVFQEREAGESKVTWRQYKDYVHHLLRLRIASGRLGCWSHRFDFPIGRFIRHAFVGFTGLLIDMGVLFIFYDRLNLGLTRSAMVAAEVAIINNFLWNDRWTFEDLSRQQGT